MANEKIKIEIGIDKKDYDRIKSYCSYLPGETVEGVLSQIVYLSVKAAINEVRSRIDYYLKTGKQPPGHLPVSSLN